MRIEITLRNPTDVVVSFYLEPWGELHRIEAGGTVTVGVEAPTQPAIEIELGPIPMFIVNDPAGAIATVYKDNVPMNA
jgi:hypothetical protein